MMRSIETQLAYMRIKDQDLLNINHNSIEHECAYISQIHTKLYCIRKSKMFSFPDPYYIKDVPMALSRQILSIEQSEGANYMNPQTSVKMEWMKVSKQAQPLEMTLLQGTVDDYEQTVDIAKSQTVFLQVTTNVGDGIQPIELENTIYELITTTSLKINKDDTGEAEEAFEIMEHLAYWRIGYDLRTTFRNVVEGRCSITLQLFFPTLLFWGPQDQMAYLQRRVGREYESKGQLSRQQFYQNELFQGYLEVYQNKLEALHLIRHSQCESGINTTLRPHPYQKVFELLFHPYVDQCFRCSIETPTGSGKTRMMISAIENFRVGRDVYVLFNNDPSLQQFEREYKNYLSDKGIEKHPTNVSCYKYTTNWYQQQKFGAGFPESGLFIIDESHLLWDGKFDVNKNHVYTELLKRGKNRAVLLVSATQHSKANEFFWYPDQADQERCYFMKTSTWKLNYYGLTSNIYPKNLMWPLSIFVNNANESVVNNEKYVMAKDLYSAQLDPLRYIHYVELKDDPPKKSPKPTERMLDRLKTLLKYVLFYPQRQGVHKIGLFCPKGDKRIKFDEINNYLQEYIKSANEARLYEAVYNLSQQEHPGKYTLIKFQLPDSRVDLERSLTEAGSTIMYINGANFSESISLSGLDFLVILSPIQDYKEYTQVVGRVFRGCNNTDRPVSIITLMPDDKDVNDSKKNALKKNALESLSIIDHRNDNTFLMERLINATMSTQLPRAKELVILRSVLTPKTPTIMEEHQHYFNQNKNLLMQHDLYHDSLLFQDHIEIPHPSASTSEEKTPIYATLYLNQQSERKSKLDEKGQQLYNIWRTNTQNIKDLETLLDGLTKKWSQEPDAFTELSRRFNICNEALQNMLKEKKHIQTRIDEEAKYFVVDSGHKVTYNGDPEGLASTIMLYNELIEEMKTRANASSNTDIYSACLSLLR